jgi:hypothetical protein
MAAIADLERLLERVFERTSARLFRSRVQAVQVERRVERAMEAGRTGRGGSTLVPNRFRVRMHPSDLDDIAARSGGPVVLGAVLADRALAFARLHNYHLAAKPTVSVVADLSAERGMVEVDASVWRPDPGGPAPDDLAALVAPARGPAGDDAAGAPPAARHGVAAGPRSGTAPREASAGGLPTPASPAAAGAPHAASTAHPSAQPAVQGPGGGLRAAADRPYSVRPAVPPPARALLRVSEPGGREREVRVGGEAVTLGRAPDNGLVIADARVSRHHGRFVDRHGTLVYTDLGSTNGTRVNGIRVDEIVLGAGDRLQVGDVVVVVEQLPG